MRAGISFLILIVVSTGAFAEDKNNQANVYDEFRQWMKPLPDATVDEEVTARIKRHMPNLLYPVDMTSFVRPEKDVKFREQVIILQKQMGAPATGTLTLDQFNRLAEAARDMMIARLALTRKNWLSGPRTASGVGSRNRDYRRSTNPLAHPITLVRLRSSGTCELARQSSVQDSSYFSTPFDSITTWEPTRVRRANIPAPHC